MLITVGCVPCESIKQRGEIVDKLKRMYERVKIEIQSEFIFYEVFQKGNDRGSSL